MNDLDVCEYNHKKKIKTIARGGRGGCKTPLTVRRRSAVCKAVHLAIIEAHKD